MARRRAILRPLLLTLAALVAVAGLALGGLLGVAGTQGGTRALLDQARAAAARAGFILDTGAVAGTLLDRLEIRDLRLSDADGPWLTADRLAVAWSPSALLGGRLHVRAVEAGTLRILRAPDLPTPDLPASPTPAPEVPAAAGPPPLGLLGRVSLESLTLDTVLLEEPLLGDLVAFSAHMAASGRQDRDLSLTAALHRLDQPGELSLEARLGFDHALAINLAAHEPAGGALATALGLPGGPALRLSLNGDGPAEAWSGRLHAEAEDLATLALDLTLAADLQRGGLRLDLAGEAATGPLAPPIATAATAGGIALAGRLGIAPDGALTVETFSARATAWTLTSRAAMAADGALTADLDLEMPDGAWLKPFTGLPVGAASLHAGAAGRPGALSLRAEASLRDTLVAALTLAATAEVGPAGAPLPFTLAGSVEGLAPLAPDLSPDLDALAGSEGLRWEAAGRLEAGGQALTLDHLRATGAGVAVDGAARLTLAPAPAARGHLTARAADLAVFAPLAGGLALGGGLTVEARLEDGDADGGRGHLRLTTDGARTGIAAVDRLLGPRVEASTAFTVTADGLHAEAITLRAAGLRLDGALALPAHAGLDGRLVLEAPDLALADPALAGGLRLEAALSGSTAAPRIGLQAEGRAVAAAGIPLDTLSLRAEATAERLALTGLDLRAAGLALSGQAAMVLADGAASGRFDLALSAPDRFAAAFGPTPGGRLSGRLDLSPRGGGRQGASLDLEGAGLSLDGTPLAERLRLTATTADAAAAPLAITLEAAGTLPHAPLPYTASLHAAVQPGAEGTEVRLSALTLEAGAGQDRHRLTLAAPAALRLGDGASGGASVLDRLALRLDDGTLDAAWRTDGTRSALRLSGQGLPLAAIALALPDLRPAGRLDVALDLAGSATAPAGNFSLRTHGLALPEVELPGLALRVDGQVRAGELSLDAAVDGLGTLPAESEPLAVRASSRLTLAGGVPGVASTAPLSATVTWTGDAAPLLDLAPLDGHLLRGAVRLAVAVDGTVGAPRATGSLTLRDGRYENLEWGTLLTGLAAEAAFDSAGAVQVTATAGDGGQGRLEARATVAPPQSASGSGGPRITASASLHDVAVVRRDDLKAALAGTIAFAGTPTDARLDADLTTRGVDLYLGQGLGGGPSTLTVATPGEAPPPPPAGGTIVLAVRVALPGQVFVRADDFESEWQGEVQVSGSAAAPSVSGALHPVRGRASVLGKTFTLEPGAILLRGGSPPDPDLDLRLSHQAKDMTAVVRVAGSARKPAITLESTPSLPQDEIVARVLFGKSLRQLGPGQALAVAQQAARLSGALGGGPGFADRLRGATGLDVLTVGGGADGAGVEAGKYLADGVYVGVEQGLDPGSSAVTVEVELTPSLSLETRASPVSGSSVGVMWSTDY